LQIADFRLQIDPQMRRETVDAEELRLRTKEFAKRVIRLCRDLTATEEQGLIRNQLFRSAKSVGANYRATCRGRSKADFIAKLGLVLEEADESLYWMELIVETEMMKPERMQPLMDEARQLIAIFVASMNTAKA
jgi:four helix bundle protein